VPQLVLLRDQRFDRLMDGRVVHRHPFPKNA